MCEGDFPQISALPLACVVNANTKRVSRSGWSFAGADVSVDARAPRGAHDDEALRFAVGATAIYDALVGCL